MSSPAVPPIADRSSLLERIHELQRHSHADIVRSLRERLYFLLAVERDTRGELPLILRLLQARLDNGSLHDILALHRHNRMLAHPTILRALQLHDADHLLLEAECLGTLDVKD